MRLIKLKKTLLAAITFSLLSGPAYAAVKSDPICDLKTAMRKLWMDHSIYTHEFAIATLDDVPNKKEAAARLLRNQDDIGNAIAAYYGKEAGKKLTQLLREHILIAVDLIEAVKADDKAKIKEADKKWHDNAREIAKFLSKANPNWPKETLTNMLYEHLKLNTEEVTARKSKDWEADIKAYDKILAQIVSMADALTAGIVKQFPEKFKAKKSKK